MIKSYSLRFCAQQNIFSCKNKTKHFVAYLLIVHSFRVREIVLFVDSFCLVLCACIIFCEAMRIFFCSTSYLILRYDIVMQFILEL